MDKNIQKKLIVGFCILFSILYVAALLIYKKWNVETLTTLVTFFMIILVFYSVIIIQKKRNITTQDEYSDQQQFKSFRNSWITAILGISIISNLDEFGIYSFEMRMALGLVMLSMILSFWISYAIYLKRPKAK